MPIETLHPGLYYQEVPNTGSNNVQTLSNSVGGFVGTASKGKVGESVLVQSFADFVQKFGSYQKDSYLAYAVKGFFQNGGNRAYIVRTVHYDTDGNKTSVSASGQLEDSTPTPYIDAVAKSDGTWGNDLSVEITNVDTDTFTFLVKENGETVETYENVTLSTLEDVVDSDLVTVTVVDESVSPVSGTVDLSGGANGTTDITGQDYVGSQAEGTGIYALDNSPVNLLSVPGITDASVTSALATYAENRTETFVIVETPMGSSREDAVTFKEENAFNPDNGAIYAGWVIVSDPIGVGNNPTKIVPPSGHLAGVYARTDAERGEWKAPAGISADLQGVIGLEKEFSDADLDILTPKHINALRAFPDEGIVAWGARVANAGSNSKKYISVVRNTNATAMDILANTRWATFEPNNQELWTKIRLTVAGILRNRWNSGGLAGESEAEAFFVRVGEETTSASDIAEGRTNVEVGISNLKPNEFTVFRMNLRN